MLVFCSGPVGLGPGYLTTPLLFFPLLFSLSLPHWKGKQHMLSGHTELPHRATRQQTQGLYSRGSLSVRHGFCVLWIAEYCIKTGITQCSSTTLTTTASDNVTTWNSYHNSFLCLPFTSISCLTPNTILFNITYPDFIQFPLSSLLFVSFFLSSSLVSLLLVYILIL